MDTVEIIKILLFVVIALTCICFFYYLRKTKIVGNKLKEAYVALDEASVKRAREARIHLLDKSNHSLRGINKYIEGPYKLFIYSGLNRKFQGITFELWSLLIILLAAVIYFVAYIIIDNMLLSLLMLIIYVSLVVFLQKILALKNYKSVDNNLIKFLNLLENFSVTNIEITHIFHKISRYLADPLKTVLEECYYEAQTSGNVTSALYAMADKIEHPKFREIISNIEICVNYSANYTETINMSRKIILNEQRERRERKSLAATSTLDMILITGLLVVALGIVDSLVQASIWNIMFETSIGKMCVMFIISIFIFFWYKMATVER